MINKIICVGREQGTGNREQGMGNREQGTGNGEQGGEDFPFFSLQRVPIPLFSQSLIPSPHSLKFPTFVSCARWNKVLLFLTVPRGYLVRLIHLALIQKSDLHPEL